MQITLKVTSVDKVPIKVQTEDLQYDQSLLLNLPKLLEFSTLNHLLVVVN